MLLLAVPTAEMCMFFRYDLLTDEGISDHYRQIGLFDTSVASFPVDELAVDVWRTCLTPDGTGDIIGALQLREKLEFQSKLHDYFVLLEDKMAGAAVDVAKFELLVSQARSFGGLFVLLPDEPLPLEPSAASKMIGSSVDPDDREGPDGESIIYGLNTYASLIAGPGRYSFAHGTAGGGTLITATTPTDQQVSGEQVVRQSALTYARLKEQLLSEPSLFRCDRMDSQFRVTERPCDFYEFRSSVLDYAEQVRDAGVTLEEEAASAKTLIADEMQKSLRQLLSEVKALKEFMRCRFLWRRWEAFDLSMCNQALPGMLQSGAAWAVQGIFSMLLLIMHYKMWRHLLDNRIVGKELERFSKRYGYLSIEKGS